MMKDTVNWKMISALGIACRDLSAYLNDNTNQNKPLIFTLSANTLPPNLKAKSPVLGTTESLPLWKYRFEKLFLCDQGSLAATDDEQLLIIGLVQADPDGQIQAHAPVLDLAWESTVHCVDDEDGESEDVHGEHGQEHEGDIAHP